ncbi:MAG TPA: sigma-54 dependent transcriptional regulator [Pyrinomonadaceae bacterium]|nr:sigma-54 dependent transcriptional regulator [Pyrinomonadaceae bacterium]
MKTHTILLLDLHPSNKLSEDLRGILESAFNVVVQKVPDEADVSSDENEVDHGPVAPDYKYDLIFGILSQHSPKPELLFHAAKKLRAEVQLIAVVDEVEPFKMFELLKLGAIDYITPPLKAVDILPRVWRLLEKRRESEIVTQTLKEKIGLKHIIGKSPAFLTEMDKLPQVARCDAGVMISGETGTGKELYARALHHLSARADKPFIPVNCGAIPAELVENELFGHERGAFSGANTSEGGLLQEAEGGTIFLDEIDCLPLLAQSKLLRFLQEKEYRSLGSSKMRKADVRVIAASNVDFEDAVATGRMRKDLYYRLNVIRLVLPPLRERHEDIPLLIQHFLVKYANEVKKELPSMSPEIVQMLMDHNWPGNVRELEHVIERAVVLSNNGTITFNDITLAGQSEAVPEETFRRAKAIAIDRFEKAYIQRLLLTNRGNITRAARAARKNRRAFWELIRKHGIEAQSFRECPS